jgi:hypothetical protein
MILGAILDSWDPLGLNNELSAQDLEDLCNSFDKEFINRYMSSVSIGNDEYGNPVYGAIWPVEYYADNLMVEYENNDTYKSLHSQYAFDYIHSLTYNSDGEIIGWPNEGELLTSNVNSILKNYSDQYFMVLAGKNTVLSNWFKKNWIIILIVILLIVIFLLFIK